MNYNDDQTAMLDRIAKLLAKAKSTTNEHEAALFAAKAAELLAEHNLTEEMLRSRDGDREQGPIGSHDYEGRVPDRWRELILLGCAKLYFCQLTINTTGGKKRYIFHGREHNAIVAKLMAQYLIATVKRMAREHTTERVRQGDFRRGAGARLYERLVELYEAQNKPAPSTISNPGNLPALYASEAKEVAEYIANKIGKLRSTKRKGMRIGMDGLAGRSAADRINLNKQVAEKRSNRLLA